MIIDSDVEEVPGPSRIIKGHADHQTLEQAGIQQVAGIVAGTDSDHDNLSILMCVRSLRPNAFTIVRQNSHDNQVAFNAARADLILQSSLTTARRILKHLISPQIQILIDYLGEQGETITQQVVDRLNMAIGEKQPHLWRVNLCDDEAIATVEYLKKGGQLRLGELLRDPYNLEGKLSCIPLAIERGDKRIMLPADNEPILECDEILLCGTENSETMLAATLNNVYTLNYLITGIDAPRGYLFRWLTRKSAAAEQG